VLAVITVLVAVRDPVRTDARDVSALAGTGDTSVADAGRSALSSAAAIDVHGAASAAAVTLLPRRFWAVLGVLLLFTLGNSSDAFLLLRAQQLGVPVPLLPILWAVHHMVKSAASVPGGALSDRIGRRTVMLVGWAWYALVYAGFALATNAWQAWALFLAYGLYFGLVEGAEKALIADLAPADRRGTAFGWYNAVMGIAALPASVLLGAIWSASGPAMAFRVGALIATSAFVLGVFVLPRRAA
jgi:MFS family permease